MKEGQDEKLMRNQSEHLIAMDTADGWCNVYIHDSRYGFIHVSKYWADSNWRAASFREFSPVLYGEGAGVVEALATLKKNVDEFELIRERKLNGYGEY